MSMVSFIDNSTDEVDNCEEMFNFNRKISNRKLKVKEKVQNISIVKNGEIK